MNADEKMMEKLEYLQECAMLEGCEMADAWYMLISTYGSTSEDCLSEEFQQALINEIDRHYQDLKENWKIVTEKREVTRTEEDKYILHRSQWEE